MSTKPSPTPIPWKWHQCGKDWVLWGDHGHRPIVLDGKKLRVRNQEHCVMVPFDPNHPDAALIIRAVNNHERLVEALKPFSNLETGHIKNKNQPMFAVNANFFTAEDVERARALISELEQESQG